MKCDLAQTWQINRSVCRSVRKPNKGQVNTFLIIAYCYYDAFSIGGKIHFNGDFSS